MKMTIAVTALGLLGVVAAAASLLAVTGTPADAAPAKDTIQEKSFGKTKDGAAVSIYTLTNANGVQAKITNYGGTVVSLMVPDKSGKKGDVVQGFDDIAGYQSPGNAYFGALIGRYGNRIAKGKFSLDGNTYTLAVNNGANSLHGGLKGFDKAVWAAKPIPEAVGGGVSLELTYLSKDGEEGYPGNLSVKVVYTLGDDDSLKIDYTATTDKDTVLNLTNHSYFNLNGAGSGDVMDHLVQINSSQITPVDETLIPTGELKDVAGTPFDFRQPTAIGARINSDDQQIKFGGGYDHNFVLNATGPVPTPALAARVTSPKTGRVMEVYTTEPGVQFYTGNFLDGSAKGKGHKAYQKRYAFCLETQHFPDSPNHDSFPTTELKPGDTLHSTTIYKFSVAK